MPGANGSVVGFTEEGCTDPPLLIKAEKSRQTKLNCNELIQLKDPVWMSEIIQKIARKAQEVQIIEI